MALEIERKFLVKTGAWRRQAGPGVRYRQGYLSLEPGRTVRVRVAGDHAFLTLKGKAKGLVRNEFEYPIPLEDARQMLDTMSLKPIIEKTRYVLKDGDVKWEIDEFGAENRGLIVAEVELQSPGQEFAKPGWLGDEVTEDPRYSNASLVKNPYSTWK